MKCDSGEREQGGKDACHRRDTLRTLVMPRRSDIQPSFAPGAFRLAAKSVLACRRAGRTETCELLIDRSPIGP